MFDCLISNFGAYTLSDVAIFADQPKYSPFDDDGGDGDDDGGDGDDDSGDGDDDGGEW